MSDDYSLYFTNRFDNATFCLTSGEGSNAAKQAKPRYFRENLEDIAKAYYLNRHAPGADLTINGGASTDDQLSIDVDTNNLVRAGHQVMVINADGSKIWVDDDAGDDNVIIDNDKLWYGSDVSDYDDDITDISGYTVIVVGKENGCLPRWGKAAIATGAAPGAFNADDLPMTSADADKVQAVIDAIEDTLDNLTDYNKTTRTAGTALANSIVTAADVDAGDIFSGEGFTNFVRNGSFERWPQGPDAAPESEGWTEYGTATVERSTTAEYGNYSALVKADGDNKGIGYAVSNYEDYAGKTVTIAARVRQHAAGDVAIRLEDGIGDTTGTAVSLDASWQTVYCTHEVDSGASELSIYIVSSGGAAQWYLDEVRGHLGSTVKSYEHSTADDRALDDVRPKNWLLNGSYEDKASSNDDSLPDYWVKYGPGALAAARVGSPVGSGDPVSGRYVLALASGGAVGANTGIVQHIGDFADANLALAGETVCFSVWLTVHDLSPAVNTWRLALYDGTDEHYIDFEASDMSSSAWTQISVVADLSSSMSTGDLEARLYSVDGEGANDILYVDGACLNVGSRPMPGAGYVDSPSAWSRCVYQFKESGAVVGDQYIDLKWPVNRAFYPTRMDVYAGTGPGEAAAGGTATYTLYSAAAGAAEAAANLSCVIEAVAAPDADGAGASACNTLSDANSDRLDGGDYIRVYQDLDGTNADPSDVAIRLTGFALGV
jgi:hypothetical protein